ncbi:MAG: hypothetical protein ACO1N0_15385 [Fluviicola sp.]
MSTGAIFLFFLMVLTGVICLIVSWSAEKNAPIRIIDVEKEKGRGKRLAYEHKERYGEFPSWWDPKSNEGTQKQVSFNTSNDNKKLKRSAYQYKERYGKFPDWWDT